MEVGNCCGAREDGIPQTEGFCQNSRRSLEGREREERKKKKEGANS